MGIFSFFKKEAVSSQNTLSKSSLELHIDAILNARKLFLRSAALRSSGMGRSEKMAGIALSYACLLIYFYENSYHYGKANQLLSSDEELQHYLLIGMNLMNESNRKNVLANLSSNWDDFMTSFNVLKMDPSVARDVNMVAPGLSDMKEIFRKLS